MNEVVFKILSVVPENALALVAVIVVYLLINSQRKDSKKERDAELELMKFRIDTLERRQDVIDEKLDAIINELAQIREAIIRFHQEKI
jgi:chaperonin cofactor prefoldin